MNTFFLIVYGLLLTGPRGEPQLARFTFTEPHMGTTFKLILYASDEPTANRAAQAAFARIGVLDGILSDYRPTSELMQLCAKAGEGPVQVSEDLFTVLVRAQEVSRLSDGAFDVTVGPVVRLWRRARKSQQLPDAEKLTQARALVGYQNLRLDDKARTVELLKPGMQLDLGGIAKGYTADEVLRALRQHGITRALVAAGGDIAVSRPPPDAEGWTIGIAPLEDPNQKPSRYLLLHDAAVSTSGDAEQYVEINGKRYSHIVDPRTGIGLVGRQSVTVVARHGIMADSLTKVVSVLGPERGLAIIESQEGVAALVVRKTDKGTETFASKRFANLPFGKKPKEHDSRPNSRVPDGPTRAASIRSRMVTSTVASDSWDMTPPSDSATGCVSTAWRVRRWESITT
jgi:thiamine biosynthesis lipoprotein